jgi:hypothetical protein
MALVRDMGPVEWCLLALMLFAAALAMYGAGALDDDPAPQPLAPRERSHEPRHARWTMGQDTTRLGPGPARARAMRPQGPTLTPPEPAGVDEEVPLPPWPGDR